MSVQSHPGRREQALKHFVRKKNKYLKTIPREPLPPRVMTLVESREFFPNNPHTWLCDGKLLRLLDPEDPTNCDMFQVNSYSVTHTYIKITTGIKICNQYVRIGYINIDGRIVFCVA